MMIKVRGLVIRVVDMWEADRLVTIFTQEMGVLTALAKGARGYKSRKMSAAMHFCYSDFILYQKGDYYWVKEAELIESFFYIRRTVDGFALASYIVDVLSDVTVSQAETELLRLSLNSLYAIANEKYPLNKIKAAFEIRAASILGFMPDVISCSCGEKFGDFFFDIMGGNIKCFSCRDKEMKEHREDEDPHESHIVRILSEGAKIALGYCIYSPVEKIFSFNISDEDMLLFSSAAEDYLLNQLERSFKTLDFYKEVKR